MRILASFLPDCSSLHRAIIPMRPPHPSHVFRWRQRSLESLGAKAGFLQLGLCRLGARLRASSSQSCLIPTEPLCLTFNLIRRTFNPLVHFRDGFEPGLSYVGLCRGSCDSHSPMQPSQPVSQGASLAPCADRGGLEPQRRLDTDQGR